MSQTPEKPTLEKRAPSSLGLTAYRLLTRLLEPLAPRLLDARVKQGKEDEARVDERLGLTRIERPNGPLVWLHGVSVGESLSLLALIDRLRTDRPDVSVLVTTGTLTSAQVLAKRLPEGVIHQFAPVDAPCAVARFLDHWRPDAGVLVESELWPNLIVAAKQRSIPLVLASARITEKTAKGWTRAPKTARALMGGFDRIYPQDDVSAERLTGLGARIDGHVNLKLSGDPLPYDKAAFSEVSSRLGERPVIVAASTHPGEEAAIAEALSGLTQRPVLILVPRHPDRGAEIAEALRQSGHNIARRALKEPITPDTDIYLADTLSEMGVFMRLADVVVMGGSFGPALTGEAVGGHNPLEPARLARPIISGPDASNWQAVARALTAVDGMVMVRTPADLPRIIKPLLADPETAKQMGERARRAAAEAGAGLDMLVRDLVAFLPSPVSRNRP